MPKSPLQKSIQEYISKIKKTPSSPFRLPSKSISRSTKRFIKACKHPRTISFSLEKTPKSESQLTDQSDKAATLNDVDRFLFDNFKSLYINDENFNDESECNGTYEPPRVVNSPPDLYKSRRTFRPFNSLIENAGLKNSPRYDDVASNSSITSFNFSPLSVSESGSGSGSGSGYVVCGTSTDKNDSKKVMGPEDFITLLTYSPSPYDDFKQSMQEMVETRLHHHGKVDWDFMEELLSCYMNLNDKKSYKYILSAFVDLVVTLRENSGKGPARQRCSTNDGRN